ncbi:MAG: hypothetical protein NZ805_14650 [Armatimonadetes bacterium]|nr:hypothetical protein [Armatimonadota bacterium]MDW8029752.1 hypothetical protein [Armatimonadota bacterium]
MERLRRRSVTIEYVVFEDEGHSLTKRVNMLKAARLISDFLLRHMKSWKFSQQQTLMPLLNSEVGKTYATQ